jgi:TonB family protein
MFASLLVKRVSPWRWVCGTALLLAGLGTCFVQASLAEEASRKVIARVAPAYPELARRMHVTGKVKVEVTITPAGTVKAAHLVGGSPVFETSAVDAVKQWKFESAQGETKEVILLEFVGQ